MTLNNPRMITPASIKKIKEADILTVISQYVNLQKNGANHKGLSPFTQEKTPSFVVNTVKGIFKCFSTDKGGDTISFVMEIEKMTYIEAIKKIAELTNTELEYEECSQEDLKKWEEEQANKKSKKDVLQFALDFFLQHSAAPYLKNRCWTQETIQSFQIGFAPAGNVLVAEILKQNLDLVPFLNFDVIGMSENGNFYDVYQERIMIPIFDKKGKLVAFTGRNIHADSKYPKYRNSSDKVYIKGNHFFGLDKALKSIEKAKFVYLVEGTPDAIAMHNKGLKNAIASNGTAFTDVQLQLLSSITKKVCIVPQTDKAGLLALEKTAQKLITEGLNVSVLMPNKTNTDADEFLRTLHTENEVSDWTCNEDDYILYELNSCITFAQTSPVERAEQITRLGELVEMVQNDVLRNSYYDECKGIWKEFGKNYKLKKRTNNLTDALLSKNDKSAYFDYGFWEDKNCYITNKKEGEFKITNFSMNPLFFIRSQTESKYYLKLNHEFGLQSYVTINTDDLTSTANLTKILEKKGTFHFYGTATDLYKIKDKLFYNVNRAYEHNTLGQYTEMYIWENGIFFENKFFKADKYGIVEITKKIESLDEFLKLNGGDKVIINQESFTITHPAEIIEKVGESIIMSEIQKGNVFLASYTFLATASQTAELSNLRDNEGNENKFMCNPQSTLTIEEWSKIMTQVYGENGMIAIAWSFMALYRDIIYNKNSSWNPILYCFGLKGSGKSKLAESIAYLSGKPMEDGINLESGSTGVGIRRYMASRKNGIIWLNEYKNSLPNSTIGMLKGLADGSGKLQGQKTGGNETTHYKPLSSAVICGQDLPTQDPALLSRCILLNFEGHRGEREQFELLKTKLEKNLDVANISNLLQKYRPKIQENYTRVSKEVRQILIDEFKKNEVSTEDDRMILNFVSILTPFMILEKEMRFYFGFYDLLGCVMKKAKLHQNIKNTADDVEQYFNVIMTCKDLVNGLHYKIKRNKVTGITELYLRTKHVHSFYLENARKQGINPLSLPTLQDYIKHHVSYVGFTKKEKFPLFNTTSASIFNYDYLVENDIEFNTTQIEE